MKNMKINIGVKQSISNTEVRWYLTSQIVWIGKEKNYNEIEELRNISYGSFNWLWSDADTILFNQEGLDFIGAVIKLNEPIMVKRGKIDIKPLEEKVGNIKISEKGNFHCRVSDFTEYYFEDDILLSYSDKWNGTSPSIEIKLTSDFSAVLQNNEMMGIVIYNASKHLLPDGMHQVVENEAVNSDICIKLCSFFELLEKMDDDLDQYEESELKSAFMEIYEQVLPYDKPSYIALRDTIINVVDYI
ncbi:hypothetical protein L3476_22625 [Paenibacillus thiaminolyticus]|uniref:hypothetical protein n=1 Tax=Paenibacillus thiaminolyticus TaxID=49283 RepID=UPI0023505907|nr:hypothetical protein [Paenibacillus thiaminolyticus]WCR26051.1 hypothetical protein L3476_22625 [Paenibacillus thiaminolyticus]